MIPPDTPKVGPDPMDAQFREAEESFFTSRKWILILVLAGIVLRLAQFLANRSLWVDEVYLAFNIADRSFAGLLGPLDNYQAAPIGFLMAEKLAFLALGNNEYALRLFPLLSGIISLFLFAWVAMKTLRPKAVPIALALFAILAPLIYYASEVKQYSSDVTVALLLYLLALHALRNEMAIARAAMIGILGGIAIWFSHPSVFLLAGAGTTLLVRYIARKEWKNICLLSIPLGLLGASFAALFLVSLRHLVQHGTLLPYWGSAFAPFPPLSMWSVKWYIDAFFNLFANPTGLFLVGIGGFAFLAGILAMTSENRENALLLGSPIGFALIASALHKYPFEGRLLLFAVPAVLLFIGAGAERIIEKTRRIPGNAGYVFLGLLFLHPLFSAGNNLIHPQKREEIKPVMSHIAENRLPGDVIYMYASAQYAFRYYSDRYGFKEGDYVIAAWSRDNWKIYDEDMDKLAGHKRVWVLFSHVWSGSGVNEEKYFLNHLNSMGKKLDALKKTGASVYLYDLSMPAEANPARPGIEPTS